MEPRAFLVQQSGASAEGGRWPLAGPVVTVGRSDDNNVAIDDREISRRHAQIRHDGVRYVLVDLGSKNGTRVNGAPLEGAVPLVDGDEVTFGTLHRFRFTDADATIAAAAGPVGIRLNHATRQVTVNGLVLAPELAPNQFSLLALLAGQPGRVFTRDEIAAACYGESPEGVSDQAVDGVVRRLRTRLAEVDPDTEYVTAVRGHGYRFRTRS